MSRWLAVTAFSAFVCGASAGDDPTDKAADAPTAQSIYDFTVNDIDGKEVKLARYKGDVLLIVNVASL